MMAQLEKEIETALVRRVKDAGGLCLKWTCPGWTGVPDRLVLLPGGLIIFVELKRPLGGRLSAMQKWWAKQLIDLGFHYEQVWDQEDLDFFALCWLGK